MEDKVVDWLLQGDAAIRWQTMRDLLDRPAAEWQKERGLVATEGAGRQFLDLQAADGTWGGGIYAPKWTGATFTLLSLIDFGLDPANEAGVHGARQVLERGIGGYRKGDRFEFLKNDLCVWGFYLHVCAYFRLGDPILEELGRLILGEQMHDGGWNCRRRRVRNVRHSSFHTTFNVLEGLREATRNGQIEPQAFQAAEARAMEFMLQHRMFKSDKTGEIINAHFAEISYPPRWHYDILRGLDYVRSTPHIKDRRLADAIELLESKQRDGKWPAENPHAGPTHFKIEANSRQSRWNTLRALRVLRAFAGGSCGESAVDPDEPERERKAAPSASANAVSRNPLRG